MRGHDTCQLDDRFWLAIEYTPIHTQLAWRLCGYVHGVYLIASQNPSSDSNWINFIHSGRLSSHIHLVLVCTGPLIIVWQGGGSNSLTKCIISSCVFVIQMSFLNSNRYLYTVVVIGVYMLHCTLESDEHECCPKLGDSYIPYTSNIPLNMLVRTINTEYAYLPITTDNYQ